MPEADIGYLPQSFFLLYNDTEFKWTLSSQILWALLASWLQIIRDINAHASVCPHSSLYTCISFICWIMSGLANGFCWAVWPQTIDFALSSIASSLGYLRARLGLPLHVSQASGFTPSPTAAKRETQLAGLLNHECLHRRMACASWFPGRQSAAG